MRIQRTRTGSWGSGELGGLVDYKQKKYDARPLLKPVLALALFVLVSSAFLLGISISDEPLQRPGRILIVTAHPDDETVFFAPTITALRTGGHEVFLYCLTQGNARGLGALRIRELKGAAQALEIDGNHLRIENNEALLPDSKSIDWDLDLAVRLIADEVRRRSIDTIVTFDSGGITGHKNHQSCWRAVSLFVEQCNRAGCPPAYQLLTSGKRKNHNKMFDRSPSASRPERDRLARYVNKRLWRVFWAMHYHKSQWRWWSHVIFTRETYVNWLQFIDPHHDTLQERPTIEVS